MAPTREQAVAEILKSRRSCLYWIHHFVRIKPDNADGYEPFHPWPAQQEVLAGLLAHRLVVLLKARQLGQTTIVLAFALWLALFKPNQTILLFSKDLKTSKDLIKRLRMMVYQLPEWMRPRVVTDNSDELAFGNGSRFISFASKASQGDSFSASLCVVDEADLIDDLDTLLGGVKPTVSAGGRLVLLSRPDKDKPESRFKQIYRAAESGENSYWPKFLPWGARPGRTREWYEAECRDAASTDWVWSQYPATVAEALAPRQESKRLPLKWLEQCYQPERPRPALENAALAGLPGVRVYRDPAPGRQYVVGADPAGGKANPNTDLSVAQVLDRLTSEQVCVLAAKIEPSVLGDYAAQLARHYRSGDRPAGVLVERNNHGHATLSYLRNSCADVPLLFGPDAEVGFNKTDRTKVQVMDLVAETLRCGGCTVHDEQTFHELASIEAATNKAPEGLHDDCADAFGIALWAAEQPAHRLEVAVVDLPGGPQRYERPVDSDCGDGVAYSVMTGDYAVTVPPKVPPPGRARVVNLGNYQTEAEARHAHNHASALLGRTPAHPPEGELTGRAREGVEAQVMAKLRAARQIK